MKISYNWLQTYFKDPLPSPTELGDLLTFHVFEIESIDEVGNDTILDVKVLPDRAHYALSHKGVAYEIAAITNTPVHEKPLAIKRESIKDSQELIVNIYDERCIRDSKVVLKNITVETSPEWLKERLTAIGQRSISNIVDATNYVMFDRGQPLHAFDFDKLTKKDGKAAIGLKKANAGDKITTLGGKEYTLDADTLVFTDEYNNDALLDIAGIKGGTLAEVDANTKNIVVLSANFDASYIRKTSTKYGIRTDASKRSENNISPELTMDGLLQVVQLITDISKTAPTIEGIVDYYPKVITQPKVVISTDYIVKMLGVNISEPEITTILQRLQISYLHKEGVFEIMPPLWRRDLVIAQDVVEEVGRIYGYKKLPSTQLPETSFKPAVNKLFYYSNKIRTILTEAGFSEVYTYALQNKGEVEILNPLASDKNYLRKDLVTGISQSLELNVRNADLLGLDQIKIFEIGKAFAKDAESTKFALGVKNAKKMKVKEGQAIKDILQKIGEALGTTLDLKIADTDTVFELDFDALIEQLPQPTAYEPYIRSEEVTTYKKFSAYPFAVRDIAVFTPEGTSKETVRSVIEKYAGDIVLTEKIRLFDEFTKTLEDGSKKISFGFRMVFQSYERTLTEEEINAVMKSITDDMNMREGWQVR
ncbi:MAG: phenylalanine--tRNA ligase subunit beta [Patescibacteria group bacterium]